jgi:hypothetical protein
LFTCTVTFPPPTLITTALRLLYTFYL